MYLSKFKVAYKYANIERAWVTVIMVRPTDNNRLQKRIPKVLIIEDRIALAFLSHIVLHIHASKLPIYPVF